MTTTTSKRLRIIPGRGLSGRDIKNRLRNRTLQGSDFSDDQYMVDESMAQFTKMNKVDQINTARQNVQEVKRIQRQLEESENAAKRRQQENEIERKVQEKLRQLGAEQINKQSKP